MGPWLKDEPGPERSLFFWAYARNKRSVTLDLDTEDGRDALRRLAAGADFVIESEPPGRMAERGLGYGDLARDNPGLVYISITPFGQTGPKAHWQATDLTLMAAGGHAYLSGEAEFPPVRLRVPQAHAHAGADAAVAALIAHRERRQSGQGQHVDISAQQSVTLATMFRILDAPLEQTPAQRRSGGIVAGGVFLPNQYPTADGWVILGPGVLRSTGHFTKRLLRWAAELGFCDPALSERDWGSYALRLINGQATGEEYAPVETGLRELFASQTSESLIREAVERRLLLAPLLGIDEIIDSPQLTAREFVIAHDHGDGREPVRYPGPFARFGRRPIRYRQPPPQLGAHTEEVLAEPPRRPATQVPLRDAAAAPLAGVRILDLFWVLAGPGGTRMLADYGAEVVKVESMNHPDTLRVIPPYHYSMPHPEGAGGFQSANANKLGITVDHATPEGREILHALVRWADVVTESFAPGVTEQYGLDWETLRAIKPDLIMISSCLMGQTGPWRQLTGFGNLAATVTGFQQLASWPGRPPSGPFGAYTDFIAVRYNAAAILAALEHRDRSGEGQYIDQSQAEAALHFLAPAFLDYTVNGRVQGAAGNEDLDLFPHGVFPTAGEDRWIAIAVRNDDDWDALCRVMNRLDLRPHRERREVVEEEITAWTREWDGAELEALLQERGIPAHVALDTPGLYEDAQLQHRGHFIEAEHEIYGTTTIESSRLWFSRSRARRPERALSFGRDNRHVLETILDYSPEQIAALAERGVLS
jgi:crotonobetainyl-CoA:carnitine CoA-transferase CaiB-like acyl-CoA transferase